MLVNVLWALLCTAVWASFYFFLCKVNSSKSPEWNCRLVTLVHGILVVFLTSYVGYVDGPWPFSEPGSKNTPRQVFVLILSLGYFSFDMMWCMYFATEGPLMLAHHTMSILGILLAMWLDESGIESCAVLFGSEITNPLLQARWFLKKTGRYNTVLGHTVDVLFVGLFVFVRVFVGGVMLYCELISERPRLFVKIAGVALYILSWIFVIDIVRFSVRKVKQWTQNDNGVVAANGFKQKTN